MYKLKNWVDVSKLTSDLSMNIRAIDYLECNEHLIDNLFIFENENAIHIIEKRINNDTCLRVNSNKNTITYLRNNRQYICYGRICRYVHGIEFVDELLKNGWMDYIDWYELCKNPSAMHILNDSKYYNNINWISILCNPNAVEIVKNNITRLDKYWQIISKQAHLIEIIEQNMDKIDWCNLCSNSEAIHILKKNMDKLYIRTLCYNKNGFELLFMLGHEFDGGYYHSNIIFEYFDYCKKNGLIFNCMNTICMKGFTEDHMEYLQKNQEHINYKLLSQNPNIFEYDYEKMSKIRRSLPWYNYICKQ